MLSEKYVDTGWDFRSADTKQLTHCYHNYPAMMIPQIAARLLEQYAHQASLLFDPYCGTGTSLVEANVRNINAIGTDLNPLARLIARTKLARINLQILDLYLKEFNDFAFAVSFGINKPSVVLPTFKNIDYWFDKPIQKKLAVIKYFIEHITDEAVRNFFYVGFSETVREASWTRNSEFKLYRMTEKQRAKFSPDVFGLMLQKFARNRKGLVNFLERMANNSAWGRVDDFNTIHGVPSIEKETVDIVITSPPYGDSRTTVAYGQFSRLANQWLGIENANKIDAMLMGGQRKTITPFGIEIADKTVAEISARDEKRAQEVYSFYNDYQQSIANVAATVKKGGYACYVVGNRRVKGVTLPTDEITAAFFARHGFAHIETIVRNIPNKRMPSRNSPTNQTGITDSTMNHEYIVVMQKP